MFFKSVSNGHMTPKTRGNELWGFEKWWFKNILLTFLEFKNIFDKNVFIIAMKSKELRLREITPKNYTDSDKKT